MAKTNITMGKGDNEKVLDVLRQVLAQEYHLFEYSALKVDSEHLKYVHVADEVRTERQKLVKAMFGGVKPPGHIWCTLKHMLLDYECTIEMMTRATRNKNMALLKTLQKHAHKTSIKINLFYNKALTEIENKSMEESDGEEEAEEEQEEQEEGKEEKEEEK